MPERLNHPTRVVIRAAIIAALGGLLFGFDTAVISGTTDALTRVYSLDEWWLGFTVAIALIGTVIGSFIVGVPTDLFGRKKILFVIAIGYFVSAVGCALAQDWWTFLISRLIGGLSIGSASVVAPMYIAEIAPPAYRGRMVALSQLNVVAGILLSYLSNYLLAINLDPEVAWRWMLGVVAFPSLLFFLLIFGIPESPRWLVKQGRLAEAEAVLQRLGDTDVPGELAAIQTSLAIEPGQTRERLFQSRYSRAIFLAWAVAMFNQLSGINALMYYAPKIFMMAGAARESALLQSVAVGGTNLLFTILALFFIDRFGRRPLLIVGSMGTAITLAIVAFQLEQGVDANGPVVLISLLTYIAFFAFSQGAVIWVFIAEIFPNAIRAKGQALGSFTHWFMAAAISWAFPVVAANQPGLAFVFFSAMMVLQLFFAWRVMPETKGGTLEDIEFRLLQRGAH